MRNKIVPALDVGLEQAKELVSNLEEVKSELAGYKVGSLLVLEHSKAVLKELKDLTDVPLIYDGQKLSTDIPEIVKQQVESLAETEVDQLIACPMGSGCESLRAFTDACKAHGIVPIVVVKMTHPHADDWLTEKSHVSIFSEARNYDIQKFVFPATHPEVFGDIYFYKREELTLMATGFKVQGGNVELLRKLGVQEFIVGRAVYQAKDPVEEVRSISEEINR